MCGKRLRELEGKLEKEKEGKASLVRQYSDLAEAVRRLELAAEKSNYLLWMNSNVLEKFREGHAHAQGEPCRICGPLELLNAPCTECQHDHGLHYMDADGWIGCSFTDEQGNTSCDCGTRIGR